MTKSERTQRQIFRADTADVPGVLHQGILDLFCDDPWLPFDILGLDRPGSGPLIDRRAEVEYVVTRPKKDGGAHELPTWCVAVSLSPAYSRDLRAWSKGPPPRVDVLILDADTVQLPPSLEAACARPTATVLATILHARRRDLDAGRLGLKAVRRLPDRPRLRYTQTILAAVSKTHRELLEAELPVEEQDKLWEIERLSSPYLYGLEEGLERGRRETLMELVLALVEVRGLSIDDASERRIRACEQLGTLQRWAKQAREVESIGELLASE